MQRNRNKKKIAEEYRVEPVAHTKLLANQTKHSDAGATIEDEYYIFTAIRNSDGEKETIQCSMGAARDFLQIIDHQMSIHFPVVKAQIITKKNW